MNELPQELVAKMEAAKTMCSEPCPTCGVGRGRWCRDENGDNAAEIHVMRPMHVEVDKATQERRNGATIAFKQRYNAEYAKTR